MLFPLLQRKLIRGFQDHIDAGLSGAADYIANFDKLYAPCDGSLFPFDEEKGGHWLRLTTPDHYRIEFAHLNNYLYKNKNVKAGDVLAQTGNTGTQTSGPHLHIQVFNPQGERIDPEKYFFAKSLPVIAINGSIAEMEEIQRKILEYSQGMLTVSWDIIDYPLYVGQGMLTQTEAYEIAKSLYDARYKPYRYIFMFYQGNSTSAFLATYYDPLGRCITTAPLSSDAKGCAFEFSHQVQTWYNTHRGSLPFVEIVDSNFPTDDLIISKYRSVLPYVDILSK